MGFISFEADGAIAIFIYIVRIGIEWIKEIWAIGSIEFRVTVSKFASFIPTS